MPPLEFQLQALLYGVLIPAVVAAVLLLPVRLRRATSAAEGRAFGALAPLVRRRPGPLVPLLLTLTAGGAAAVLLQSANLKFAQLAGALAATLGAVTLLAALVPGQPLAAGAVLVVAVLLPGLL